MEKFLTFAFLYASPLCDWANQIAAMPRDKSSAVAKADEALAKSRQTLAEFDKNSQYFDTVLAEIAEERRMVAARRAGEQDRAARLVRKGDEARRASEDRCTGAASRVCGQ